MAKNRYLIQFKYRPTGTNHALITGYVPDGLKMSDIRKYIQGNAEDKKITGMIKLEQRHYYQELDQTGSIDVTSDELEAAQNSPTEIGLNENSEGKSE